MILTIISSLVTYELSKLPLIGAIRSSALIGILIFIIDKYAYPLDSTLLFGATFVGMCSSNRLSRLEVLIASLIYFITLYYLKSYFHGVGGLLGMSSFVGVCFVFILSSIHKKLISKRNL